MKWYAVPFALFVLVACQSSSQPENKTPATDSNSLKTLIPADSDTLYITTPSALYYRPDSLRMEQWKKRIGEEDFETVADDWSYYMMTSQDFLDSMKMPVVEAGDKKIVKFVQTAGMLPSFGLIHCKTCGEYTSLPPIRRHSMPIL